MFGNSSESPKFNLKKFEIFCKHLVSKVLCLVSLSARSSFGLVSTFCSKSRFRYVNVSSRSRRFWLILQLWSRIKFLLIISWIHII